jgi:hypothetical protein
LVTTHPAPPSHLPPSGTIGSPGTFAEEKPKLSVADAAWENEEISMGFSVLLWGSWGYIYICIDMYILILDI